MTIDIPSYVEERIRQSIPPNHFIVDNSTPVISFGDVRTAKVATLGLNPSRIEFLNNEGKELTGVLRRLESLTSLQLASLTDAPIVQVAKVFQRCNDYFLHQPYWKWFGQLEPILNLLSTSYKDGTACHLDLVQWATDPVWGNIKDSMIRQSLINADIAFLREQLSSNKIELLLLNGTSVIQTVERLFNLKFYKYHKSLISKSAQTSLVTGSGPNNIPVIGWTINIQSSFGVTNELRQMLAGEVTRLKTELY